MNRSLALFLILGVIVITSFFTWQLILHRRLEITLAQCTGDKLINNSCGLGSACIIPGEDTSSNLLSIPTTREDSIRIINEFKKDGQSIGYCIPWASLALNLPIKSQK